MKCSISRPFPAKFLSNPFPSQHAEAPTPRVRTIKRFKSPTNQVYFLVSYGYFRATARFFPVGQFHQKDLTYVAQILGWGSKPFRPATYSAETQSRHRQLIRTLCQFRCYDRMARKMIVTEIHTLTHVHWDPRHIFFRVVDRLKAARIEIPGAIYLSRLIATAVTQRQLIFAQRVQTHLTATLREALHALLTPSLKTSGHDHYHLSQLKRLSQSTKPTKVRVRLKNLAQIRSLYHLVAPLLSILDLPPAGITYYADMAMKHDVYDLRRRAAPVRYLFLLTFVVHHYWVRTRKRARFPIQLGIGHEFERGGKLISPLFISYFECTTSVNMSFCSVIQERS